MLKLILKPGSQSARGTRLIQEVIIRQQSIGNQLNISPGRDVFQAAGRGELLRQICHALRDVRPVVVFALAQNRAIERDAPGLLRLVGEAQALERNREENNVAVLGDAPAVAPESIETEIVALALSVDGIRLHAEGIREKIISTVKVPEGVQQHPDP